MNTLLQYPHSINKVSIVPQLASQGRYLNCNIHCSTSHYAVKVTSIEESESEVEQFKTNNEGIVTLSTASLCSQFTEPVGMNA